MIRGEIMRKRRRRFRRKSSEFFFGRDEGGYSTRDIYCRRWTTLIDATHDCVLMLCIHIPY